MRTFLTAALFAVSVSNIHAATLTSSELPAEIQGCLNTTCFVDTVDYEVGDTRPVAFQGMSAYRYIDLGPWIADPYLNTLPKFEWLVKYDLVSPSRHTFGLTALHDPEYPDLPSPTLISPYSGPYSGSLWLRASDTFNPADAYHMFTIYTDKAVPIPYNYANNFSQLDAYKIQIGLTTTDLLAGGGTSGSLYRDTPSGCVECGLLTDFNLVYLDYSSGTLNFNPSDQRTSLLDQYYFGWTWRSDDQFYVQVVPTPSAFILFGSGLLGLLSLKKTSSKRRCKVP